MNLDDKANKNAVVLISGGLDSATVLAMAREQAYRCYALSFDYGQRHRIELESAATVARSLGVVEHRTVKLDIAWIGGSALTDKKLELPISGVEKNTIPITYVPARNTVFLATALAWAEVIPAAHLFIGANAVDYSGYPDCRPEFLRAFEKTANLGTRVGVSGAGFSVHAPLVDLSKAEIIQQGLRLGVDYGLTLSCYDPDEKGLACGVCDSCRLRARGFQEADCHDPAKYRNKTPS